MARPRSFTPEAVVTAAKELFWARGYQGTALDDLEHATGLNRSSLYQAFGSKTGLFQAALDLYIDTFVAPLLGPMERPAAGSRDVEGFFMRLAMMFRDEASPARRGCLWVNSIAELTGRPPPQDVRAVEFRNRLRSAFANGLSTSQGTTEAERRQALRRTRVLASVTYGIWLEARVDPTEAAAVCDAMAAEVRSWRLGRQPAPVTRPGEAQRARVTPSR